MIIMMANHCGISSAVATEILHDANDVILFEFKISKENIVSHEELNIVHHFICNYSR